MIRASTLVETAALAMMGTSLFIFPVAAQQMAAATSGPIFAACDAIKDPALSAQCYHDTKIDYFKRRIVAANQQISENDKLAGCISFLKRKKADGTALDPQRLTREQACVYAIDLGMQ